MSSNEMSIHLYSALSIALFNIQSRMRMPASSVLQIAAGMAMAFPPGSSSRGRIDRRSPVESRRRRLMSLASLGTLSAGAPQ